MRRDIPTRRRHRNESQRAMIAARLANAGEGRPSETRSIDLVSQSRAAKLLNVRRRIGAMLREMEKNPGGDPTPTRLQAATGSPPTLSDLGIEKTASHRWQVMAGALKTGGVRSRPAPPGALYGLPGASFWADGQDTPGKTTKQCPKGGPNEYTR